MKVGGLSRSGLIDCTEQSVLFRYLLFFRKRFYFLEISRH